MPVCLSTWLLSMGAVPIPLICLLFSCEGLCCKRRNEGGIEVKMEGIFSCVSLTISPETGIMFFWIWSHKYIWRKLENMCNTKPFFTQLGVGERPFCEVPGLLGWLGCIMSGTKHRTTLTQGNKRQSYKRSVEKQKAHTLCIIDMQQYPSLHHILREHLVSPD